jgi:asparagine synthase (glutamine-hydrolysing)
MTRSASAGGEAARAAAALVGPWTAAVRRSVPASGRCTLLFSGGLDSSLLALSVSVRTRAVELVTVGVGDAPDLRAAEGAAGWLDLPWRGYRLARSEVDLARRRWAREIDGLTEPARSVAVALALALERSDSEWVLCGQGADELFCGYAHFAALSDEARASRARADLDRLERDDWPRARRMAGRLGRVLGSPYLDPDFRDRVLALPPESHRDPNGLRKPVLRALALTLGLPEPLARRPKRALQYGSGVRRALGRRSTELTAARGETALEYPPRRAAPGPATGGP